MQGDQLIGVVVAGSEEDPNDLTGYAISADEVYHNISRSMGGVPVRQLTTLENSILAHKARHGDGKSHMLAALYIRQLFDASAHVGSIRSCLMQSHLMASGVEIGINTLASFLRLGNACSSLLRGPALERIQPKMLDGESQGRGIFGAKHLNMANHAVQSPSRRDEDALYWQLIRYNEGLAVITLILALSAISASPGLRVITHETGSVVMLSALMRELDIFPLPTPDQLQTLVKDVCDHNTLPAVVNVGMNRQGEVWLSRSLGRMIYALHTGRFFVHSGHSGSILENFMRAYYDNDVVIVNEALSAIHMRTTRRTEVHYAGTAFQVPRIYIAGNDDEVGQETKRSRFSPLYGDIIEYSELNDLLEEMKREAEMKLSLTLATPISRYAT